MLMDNVETRSITQMRNGQATLKISVKVLMIMEAVALGYGPK